MLTWTLWSSHQHNNHNVTNIQQATWYTQNQNQLYQYSANTFNYPTSAFSNSSERYNYPASVPPAYSNIPNSQRYNSIAPTPPYFSRQEERRKSIPTMDYEKYYQISRFNEYSVHFPNQHGIPTNEIKDLCKKFGEISSCKQTGDQFGLFFINYKTEEGAKNCIDGLKDHPKIKLRMIKLYNASRNGKSDNGNETKKQDDGGSSSGWNNAQMNKDSYNRQRKGSCNSSNVSEKKFDSMEISETNEIHDECVKDNNSNSKNYSDNKANDTQTLTANKTNEMTENEMNNQQDVALNDMPELVLAPKATNTVKDDYAKATKLIVTNGERKSAEVIEAQEVIVANIEDNYGTPAILHLLEKYNPICASPIKISKPHSLRYCHVYFNSVDRAEAVERDFDEYEWSQNRKLIVLKVNTLAALATA